MEGEAQFAQWRQQARPDHRTDPRRDHHRQPFGHLDQTAAEQDEDPPARHVGALQAIFEPQLAAQRHAPRLGPDERVGPALNHEAVLAFRLDLPAPACPRLQHRELHVFAAFPSLLVQRVGRGQSGDSAADDDDAVGWAHSHLRAAAAWRTRSARLAIRRVSAPGISIRSSRAPPASASWRRSMSMSYRISTCSLTNPIGTTRNPCTPAWMRSGIKRRTSGPSHGSGVIAALWYAKSDVCAENRVRSASKVWRSSPG